MEIIIDSYPLTKFNFRIRY